MINVIHMITDELTRELAKDFRDPDTGMFTNGDDSVEMFGSRLNYLHGPVDGDD